ncbi:MAG: helix-turn-helix domain-containing protein [Lachnospiraceae bacterium]|nr:helix-turn-helix domain-containing protein [Lachnospiraceae bacterium]
MNVLIVDDDKLLIQKIVTGIEWEEIGIKHVFTADNAIQARKILESFPVDILVADIEMPQGNGLELLEWARARHYPVETIILSGYAHFSYAQKVIQYGGRDYLLKPVSNRDLAYVIRSIVQEKENRSPHTGERNDRFALWEKAFMEKELQIPSEILSSCGRNSSYCMELFRNLSNVGQNDADRRLLDFVVQNMIQEFFESRGLILEYAGRVREDAWLALFKQNARLASIEEYTVQMQQCLSEVVHLDFCVYLGIPCALCELPADTRRLWRIYQDAVPDDRKFIREADWELRNRTPSFPDFKKLASAMERDIPLVEKELLDCVSSLAQNGVASRANFQALMNQMMPLIEQSLASRNVLRSRIFDEAEFAEKYRLAFLSVSGMTDWISWSFGRLEGYRHVGRKQEYLVDKLKEYIEDHLDSNLSRKELSGIVFLSEDYLSRIFTAATGMSISSYVSSRRIARAQKYLLETGLTVSQVAMRVGFSNFSYFSKIFRDFTGKTPNEYRDSVKNPHPGQTK